MIGRFAAAFTTVLLAGRASAQGCQPITELPASIYQPGTYCLVGDLSYDGRGSAIQIVSDDVMLDLGGFTLAGTRGPGADSRVVGIYSFDRKGLTVQNGTITGFHFPVYLDGAHSSHDLHVSHIRAVDDWYFGIFVAGPDSVIEDCTVSRIGGTTLPGYTIAIGLQATGDRVQILNNVVTDVIPQPGGEAVGITLSNSVGSLAQGNTVANRSVLAGSWAFWLSSPTSGGLIADNLIIRYQVGIPYPTGSSGSYARNLFFNVTTPVLDGRYHRSQDLGGNQIIRRACEPVYSLPYTIGAQGNYCLLRNLSTAINTGSAVEITTDFVVLDLLGFKIGGGAAGLGTQADGIHALDHRNLTVRNGNVRGFRRGVALEDSTGASSGAHLVENLRADDNTQCGLWVEGRGSRVRGNQVVSTGHNTLLGVTDGCGIRTEGSGVRVIGNDVTETVGSGGGTGLGIAVKNGNGAVVEANRVGVSASDGAEVGIQIESGSDVLVLGNKVTGTAFGIRYTAASGKFRDNQTAGVGVPYSGGTDAGKNN